MLQVGIGGAGSCALLSSTALRVELYAVDGVMLGSFELHCQVNGLLRPIFVSTDFMIQVQ